MNNKNIKTIILTPALLLASTFAMAGESVSFFPRATVGVSEYSLVQSARRDLLGPGMSFPELEFSVLFKVLGVGGTVAYDRYYMDLYFQGSTKESDEFKIAPGQPGGPYNETFKGDREDRSLTFGVRGLDNKGAAYLGYKYGKSAGKGSLGSILDFETTGYFVGVNYGWVIANKGVLSANVAYAILAGDVVNKPGPGPFRQPGVAINAESEGAGVSYGFSWNSSFTDHLGYSVGLDANSYTFDNAKDDNARVLPKEYKEEFITAKFTLSYSF